MPKSPTIRRLSEEFTLEEDIAVVVRHITAQVIQQLRLIGINVQELSLSSISKLKNLKKLNTIKLLDETFLQIEKVSLQRLALITPTNSRPNIEELKKEIQLKVIAALIRYFDKYGGFNQTQLTALNWYFYLNPSENFPAKIVSNAAILLPDHKLDPILDLSKRSELALQIILEFSPVAIAQAREQQMQVTPSVTLEAAEATAHELVSQATVQPSIDQLPVPPRLEFDRQFSRRSTTDTYKTKQTDSPASTVSKSSIGRRLVSPVKRMATVFKPPQKLRSKYKKSKNAANNFTLEVAPLEPIRAMSEPAVYSTPLTPQEALIKQRFIDAKVKLQEMAELHSKTIANLIAVLPPEKSRSRHDSILARVNSIIQNLNELTVDGMPDLIVQSENLLPKLMLQLTNIGVEIIKLNEQHTTPPNNLQQNAVEAPVTTTEVDSPIEGNQIPFAPVMETTRFSNEPQANGRKLPADAQQSYLYAFILKFFELGKKIIAHIKDLLSTIKEYLGFGSKNRDMPARKEFLPFHKAKKAGIVEHSGQTPRNRLEKFMRNFTY